jgi:iron complex outermembrane receptor protein
MSFRNSATFVGSSLLAFGATLTAQAQTGPSAESRDGARSLVELEEVVVSVRRRAELIQDVPQSVQAVSGEALEKLNLFQFDDLSKIAPGVSLSRAGGSVTTIRGVSFSPTAQTNPAVSFYVNEAPVQPSFLFQSMFDVGQIEILRGPQGTLRGQSAPTGAITVTTRKPDLYQSGGTAIATATDKDGRTFQGAVNVPVIEGKFALRLAGIADNTNNGGVRSANSSGDPSLRTEAFRISASVEPIDNLSATVVYQNLTVKSLSFGGALYSNGVAGSGKSSPGFNAAARQTGYALPFTQPAGYNGPVIPIGELLAVTENADRSKTGQELASAQVDYVFAGQKLSYDGGWSVNHGHRATNFGDTGNLVLGDYPGRSVVADLTRRTHELRLSSDERIGGLFDYVVGAFYLEEDGHNDVNNGLSFQPGAFGSPLGAPLAQAPNLRYSTVSLADISNRMEEISYFANLTVHLGEKTELSGGVRFINAKKDGLRVNSGTSGFRARGDLTSAASCTAAGGMFGTTYAGVCDVPVAVAVSPSIVDKWDKSPVVYSATLSHHFTPDLMVYANHGTSWRPGPTQGNLVNGTNDPLLNSLVALDDEKTKSYEAGVKSSWLDRRLTANLAYYHQTYDGLVYSDLTGIPYVADNGQGVRQLGFAIPMNSNIDATIDGVDVDASFSFTDRWSVRGGVSWADGRYSNQLIPCKDANFDGIADTGATSPAQFPAGVLIARCAQSGRSSPTPKWNAILQPEYSHPIGSDMDAFISGVLTYTPENPYADRLYKVPSYALLNLNLGLRSPGAGWELQVFARNLTNEDTVTAKGTSDIVQGSTLNSLFGTSGYSTISYLPRREYGISLRYSFGSR